MDLDTKIAALEAVLDDLRAQKRRQMGEKALLAALRTPIKAPCPGRQRPERHRRQVYLGKGGRDWYVTYGGEIPYSGPFDDATVQALVELGALVPVYPGTEAEKQAYWLPAAAEGERA